MSTQTYEAITGRIIDALERGVVPWRRPWNVRERGELRNGVTGHRYNGINPILLSLTAYADGYSDPRWITFKQAQAHGGHVRKGEKGTPVVLWKWIEREDRDGEPERIPFLRRYSVFNVQQCEGVELPDKHAPGDVETREIPAIEAAERIVREYQDAPTITHDGGSRAFYRLATDSIHLPPRETFESAERFYHIVFHELAHSTGHPSRLGRKSTDEAAPFGSPVYSREELIAEFGAAFLTADAGISGDAMVEHSAAYVSAWLQVLRNDSRVAIIAAAMGSKAADYVRGR